MPEDNPDYLSAIHQLLVQHYNAEELRSLCFRLGVDYDDLPPGGRESKARELITYLNRRGRLPELKAAVKADRPSAVWRTAAGGGAMPTSQSTTTSSNRRTSSRGYSRRSSAKWRPPSPGTP